MPVWTLALVLAAYAPPPIEAVYAVAATPQGLAVTLASNGCTRKADLTLAVAKSVTRPLLLVARKHPDICEARSAQHVRVDWTWAELGLDPGQPFSLANPLTSDPAPGP